MNKTIYDSGGRKLTLGQELGRAGEGVVLNLSDDPRLAAKIYHKPISQEKQQKLALMTARRTDRLISLAAWPLDTLHNKPNGDVVGFLMPIASQPNKLHDLYGVKSRLTKFPQATWRYLIHTARNLARAFHVIHDHGFVVGDVNEGNVFVTAQATVILLDCDSFQVTSNGQVFVPGVGVENYTPPEAQGLSFRDLVRTQDHDAFGLAVLIFLLLFMGKHPHSGVYQGTGDMPIGKAIEEYRFAYGKNAISNKMLQPPASLPLSAVSPAVAELFERAFVRQLNKRPRPSPAEWSTALDELLRRLKLCSQHSGHVFWNGLSECPWCLLERAAKISFFNYSSAAATPAVDIASLWSQLNSITEPALLPAIPVTSHVAVSPSPWAIEQKNEFCRGFGAVTALLRMNKSQVKVRESIIHELRLAETARQKIEESWNRNTAAGNALFLAKRQELKVLHREYLGLDKLRLEKAQKLVNDQYQIQLAKYLDRYEIGSAFIEGIGTWRTASLLSFGIETAADITPAALAGVPGFGPVLCGNLFAWRRALEARFSYNPAQGVDTGKINQIENEVRARRYQIANELTRGVEELRKLSDQLNKERENLIKVCDQNLQSIKQQEVDLKYV